MRRPIVVGIGALVNAFGTVAANEHKSGCAFGSSDLLIDRWIVFADTGGFAFIHNRLQGVLVRVQRGCAGCGIRRGRFSGLHGLDGGVVDREMVGQALFDGDHILVGGRGRTGPRIDRIEISVTERRHHALFGQWKRAIVLQ